MIEVMKLPEEVYQQTSELDRLYQRRGIGQYRRWFRDAVDYWRKWQDEAREDYDFVEGRQWTKAELLRFRETMRPAITINRVRPLLNVLGGWQQQK